MHFERHKEIEGAVNVTSVTRAIDNFTKAIGHHNVLQSYRTSMTEKIRYIVGNGNDIELQVERGLVRPWNVMDYKRRLKSFNSSSWWFAKALSPSQCARAGWCNTGSDQITCFSCYKQIIVSESDVDLCEFKKLLDAHEHTCGWRHNECSEIFSYLPPITLQNNVKEFLTRLGVVSATLQELVRHHGQNNAFITVSGVKGGGTNDDATERYFQVSLGLPSGIATRLLAAVMLLQPLELLRGGNLRKQHDAIAVQRLVLDRYASAVQRFLVQQHQGFISHNGGVLDEFDWIRVTVLLALAGWGNRSQAVADALPAVAEAGSVIIECGECGRALDLRHFVVISAAASMPPEIPRHSGTDGEGYAMSRVLDVLSQHRAHCPWLQTQDGHSCGWIERAVQLLLGGEDEERGGGEKNARESIIVSTQGRDRRAEEAEAEAGAEKEEQCSPLQAYKKVKAMLEGATAPIAQIDQILTPSSSKYMPCP